MAVVVDASAIGAIAFGEPEGPTLRAQLAGETLLAPALIDFELMNLALKKARRRPDQLPAILAALQATLRLAISRVPVPGPDVWTLALQTGLTAYDASYLWLAVARDIELVTLDSDLARVADARESAASPR
jgi:predicted nucleic acid-binding protein